MKQVTYKVFHGISRTGYIKEFKSLAAALSFVARKRAKWLADEDHANFSVTREFNRIALGGMIREQEKIIEGCLLNQAQIESGYFSYISTYQA